MDKKTLRHKKYKKIISRYLLVLPVIFAMVFSTVAMNPGVARAAHESVLYFDDSTPTAVNGGSFTLIPTIDTGANDVSIVSLHITFDQTKITLDTPALDASQVDTDPESLTYGMLIPVDPTAPFISAETSLGSAVNNTNGTMSLDVSVGNANSSANGILKIATLTFHAISTGDASIAFTGSAGTSGAAADNEVGNVVIDWTPATATITTPELTYTVTPSAGENGSIDPSTAQTVGDGLTTQFTVTPSDGYSASVGGSCGGTLVGTTYTTDPISSDCTVEATFSSNPTYTVGGSISGLLGTVVLQNNGTDDLSLTSNDDFTFHTALEDGTHYIVTVSTQPVGQNCTLTGDTGDISANVTGVSVSCENVGPWRSDGAPSGNLDNGTSQTTLALSTDVNATCGFSTTPDTAFGDMTNTFDGAGSQTHTYALTGLSDGTDYLYYVRCQDESLAVNTDDYLISFSVDNSSDSKKEAPKKRKITNAPDKVKRGRFLYETGKRFSKKSNVALYFSKYGGGYYAPVIVKTDWKGRFSLSYKIPLYRQIGTYKWYAIDLKTGKRSKTIYYRVNP